MAIDAFTIGHVAATEARLGPAAGYKRLLGRISDETSLLTEVMDIKGIVIDGETHSPLSLVNLSIPEQISRRDADALRGGMPVYLCMEDQVPFRSEPVDVQFNELAGVVQNGELLLTHRSRSGDPRPS